MRDKRIIRGDVIRFCELYRGEKFHALLCDPPYHLTSIEKRFGKSIEANEDYAERTKKVNPYARVSKQGFMGKTWDGGDIAFNPETWAAFASVMHDGAFGMAFASARGWHRLACAIEDAGYVLHPSVLVWNFATGFPKSTRVKGDERFAGHRYGLQCLKPAVEIIVVFQKPYRGKPVECITRTGAGALNIDGGRIGYKSEGDKRKNTEGLERFHSTSGNSGTFMASDKIKPNIDSTSLGRWAANFIVSHSPDCVHIGDNGASRWACVAECAVRRLDEQSGERKTCSPNQIGMGRDGNFTNGIYGAKASKITTAYGDTGGASRFFFNVAQQIDEADPVRYCAKASRRERDAGCEGMREYNAGTYAQDEWSRQNMGNTPDAKRNPIHNPHPTVKPMSLTRYLATLLLPPAEYAPRRIFVPFGGSGSEIIGCALAGWEEVVGVEREQEYVSIAKARVKFWVAKMKENYSSDPSAILKTCGKKDKEKPDLQEHSPAESLFEISAKE